MGCLTRAQHRKALPVVVLLIVGYFILHNRDTSTQERVAKSNTIDRDAEEASHESFERFADPKEQKQNTSRILDILREDELKERAVILDIYEQHLKYNLTNTKNVNCTILTVNAKLAPVIDIAWTLKDLGVKLIIMDLKEAVTNSLYGIKFPRNVLSLQDEDVEFFYRKNKDSKMLKSIDAFLCVYPIALCKLFKPFNKPLILYIEDRYEAASHRYYEWTSLNDVIHGASNDPGSSVLASNPFDMEYVRFFTRLVPLHIPFTCSYLNAPVYTAKQQKYLVWSSIDNSLLPWFLEEFKKELDSTQSDISFTVLTDSNLQSSVLKDYSAIIVLPHQVSFLAFTELYRMNIPIFVPSLDLLTRWHHQHRILHLKG